MVGSVYTHAGSPFFRISLFSQKAYHLAEFAMLFLHSVSGKGSGNNPMPIPHKPIPWIKVKYCTFPGPQCNGIK